MSLTDDLGPELLAYLVECEEQRQQDIAEAWPTLKADIDAFLTRFTGQPDLPGAVARLVWEIAVAAFVRGTMHAAGTPYSQLKQPMDSVMVYQARETTRSMPDIYPAFALLDGRGGEDR